MKKVLSVILIPVILLSLFYISTLCAYADTEYQSGDFYYTVIEDSGASISKWDSDSGHLVIPAVLDTLKVTAIQNWCFNERTDITSVNFSQADYLKTIGAYAFKNCTGLSGTLTITATVKSIGMSAFQGCSSLEMLYYNTSAAIPTQCFYTCTGLKTAVLSDGVTSIGRLAFAACDSLEFIRIPENVTSIDEFAFNNCPNLVIYCYTDSYAHQYAVDNGFNYVLIDAPVPTEPPTEPPTDAPTEPPTDVPEPITFMLGDADGDGMVTILDATKIQRILVDLDTDDDGMITLRSLVDGADTLNIMHATKIQRWIAGFKTDDPIGEIVTG